VKQSARNAFTWMLECHASIKWNPICIWKYQKRYIAHVFWRFLKQVNFGKISCIFETTLLLIKRHSCDQSHRTSLHWHCTMACGKDNNIFCYISIATSDSIDDEYKQRWYSLVSVPPSHVVSLNGSCVHVAITLFCFFNYCVGTNDKKKLCR